ncbi:MAG TPA: hypothetical protein VFR58_09445 [Flavisolibacter sp.]|nr:hypothetical protein [Flavisolibacter sp.]
MKKTLKLSLLLSVFFVQTINAQTPGGVNTSLKLWIRAGSGTNLTGTLVNSWTYVNDNTKTFTGTGTQRPTLTANLINFNPAVTFNSAQWMDGPTGANAPIPASDDDYTVFGVWQSNIVNDFQRIWVQRTTLNTNNDALAFSTWNDGRYGDETGSFPFDHTIPRPYTAGAWNISQLNLLNQATADLEIIDDRNISTGITTATTDPAGTNGAALRNLGATVNRLGANHDNAQPLNGSIAELVVYDRPINGTERARLFSYFALKYGIPIKTNIVSSNGTVVWDATANSTYNNAVFGLALDNTSGLSVTSSNSIETGSGNGVGKTGQANIVLSNPSALTTDQTFLLIGHDNASLTQTTTNIPPVAAGSQRLARQWKVQSTGSAGSVSLAIHLNGLTVTGTNPTDFRLMVDLDGNGDFTTGTVFYYTPVSYAGNVLTFNNVPLANNNVFALVTSATASTPLPVTWTSFTAKVVDKKIQLDWSVENNDDAKHYEIEHSLDKINFTQVGIVNNQAGVVKYSFIYPNLTGGRHHFRIRQVDLDGKAVYSKLVSIKESDINIRVINNPVRNGRAEVEIAAYKAGTVTLELRSLSGATVISLQQKINPGVSRVSLPISGAASGQYILTVHSADMKLTERILKL